MTTTTSITSMTLLYGIIETVIFMIPLGALIWKAATLASRVNKAESEIKEMKTDIEKKVEKQNDTILKTLDKLTVALQELKVEVAVIKAMRCEEVNITKDIEKKD